MGLARAPIQALVVAFRVLPGPRYEYALFRRSDESYWQVIAGGGEGDESPLAAARREAFEEAGIPQTARYYPLKTLASIPVTCFRPGPDWPKDLYIVPGYYFAVDASDLPIRLSAEHTECGWFQYEDAVSLPKWDTDKTAIWELNERLVAGDLPDPPLP